MIGLDGEKAMFVAPRELREDISEYNQKNALDKARRDAILYRYGRRKIGKGVATLLRIAVVVTIGCSMLALLCRLTGSEPVKDAGAAQAAGPADHYNHGYVLLPASQPRYAQQYVPANTYGRAVPY